MLEVEGELKLNPRYGEQLEVKSVNIKKPTSSIAIQKYLACGLISKRTITCNTQLKCNFICRFKTNIDSLLQNYQSVNKITLHLTQQKAIECAVNNGVIFAVTQYAASSL